MTPEEKIEDLKANFDYILEGKDLEIKTLGERCNQLLKDKGDLTDRLAEEVELHLHAEDYIKSLEQQIEKMKCCGNCKGVCNSDDTAYFCKNNNYKLWEIKEND